MKFLPPGRAPRALLLPTLAACVTSAFALAACGGSGSGASNSPDSIDLAPGQSVVDFAVTGWSTWTKRVEPVFDGPYSLVSDPSVIRDGAIYRMFHTCFDVTRKLPDICQATSSDGMSFTEVPTGGSLPGGMVPARPGQWDDTHETSAIVKFKGQYLLYFAGYRDRGGYANSFPISIGLATSMDGTSFARVGSDPVLQPSPGARDGDAVFSPALIAWQDQLVMVYTGICRSDCVNGPGPTLLYATSSDGTNWTKRASPVLSESMAPQDGASPAEADIVAGPDGVYYLFVTWLLPGGGYSIGAAYANTPLGPWTVSPSPIIKGSNGRFDSLGPLAPSVIFEGSSARMWFHGFDGTGYARIGYANASAPLKMK